MNTFFKKAEQDGRAKKPDGRTKNQIDFMITDKKQIVTDVTVLNRLSVENDHRMVKAEISLYLKAERFKLVIRNNSKKWTNADIIEKYQKTINENLKGADTCNIEDLNKNIVETINSAQK